MAADGSVSITMKQSSKKRSSVFFAADSVQTTVKEHEGIGRLPWTPSFLQRNEVMLRLTPKQ